MMLFKYPLPDEWKEVYDAGVKRHYYWNAYTDEVSCVICFYDILIFGIQVSWLPPRHPHSVIGSAAQALAKGLHLFYLKNLKLLFQNFSKPRNTKLEKKRVRKADSTMNVAEMTETIDVDE